MLVAVYVIGRKIPAGVDEYVFREVGVGVGVAVLWHQYISEMCVSVNKCQGPPATRRRRCGRCGRDHEGTDPFFDDIRVFYKWTHLHSIYIIQSPNIGVNILFPFYGMKPFYYFIITLRENGGEVFFIGDL